MELATWRKTLHILAATLTQSTRDVISPEWSSNSWTHNVFRTLEYVFGRKHGIRPEIQTTQLADGRVVVYTFTLEGAIAVCESTARSFFSSLKPAPFRVYVPMMALPGGFPVPVSPYLFAIAFDVATIGGNSGGTSSFTVTVTGTNPVLLGGNEGRVGGANDITAASYNSVALTKSQEALVPADRWVSLWYLVAPATGANTYAITGGAFIVGTTVSYTGVAQSGFPDSSNFGTQSGSLTSFSLSTTAVGTTCWAVAMFKNGAGGVNTAGTATTMRGSNNDMQFCDSNATGGSGTRTLAVTGSAAAWGGCILTMATFVPFSAVRPIFLRQAVNRAYTY